MERNCNVLSIWLSCVLDRSSAFIYVFSIVSVYIWYTKVLFLPNLDGPIWGRCSVVEHIKNSFKIKIKKKKKEK